MIARETRSRLLSKTLASESGQDLRTREVWIARQSHGHPDEGSEVPRVRPVQIRIEGRACHVSNGGVLCEVAMCAFRGGPYICPFFVIKNADFIPIKIKFLIII